MFSTAQMDIMRPLVAEMRDQGYLYYLAYQNYSSSSSGDFDIYMIFSKESITAADMYIYNVPGNSIKYSIRSGNAYTNNLTPRLVTETLSSSSTVVIREYQHISTNAAFTTSIVQPDLFLEVKQYETQGSLLFIVCVFLCLFSFFKLFRR